MIKKQKAATLGSLLLPLAVLFSTMVPAFAAMFPTQAPENEPCQAIIAEVYGNINVEEISSISRRLSTDDFGGLYRNEDGQIVINVVDLEHNIDAQIAIAQSGGSGVIFSSVNYSLAFLEEAVDALIPYMKAFHILSLDANDQTNFLDICLSDYSESNLSQLKAVIESLSIPAECVNYIDCTGLTARPT